MVTPQVDITEDQTSPDQLREAFEGVAGNKVSAVLRVIRSLATNLEISM